MKKIQGIVLLLCIMLIGYLYHTLTDQETHISQDLKESALAFVSEDYKLLEKAKIDLQRQKIQLEIAKLQDEQAAIPFWRAFKHKTAISIMVVSCACILILSLYYGHSRLREKSIVTQKIGNSELKIHYRMVKQPEFILYCSQVNEIETIRAQYPEKGLEMLCKLQEIFTHQLRALAGRRRGFLGLLEQTNQVIDLPHVQSSYNIPNIPSFRDILDDLSEGDDMVLGYDLDSGKAIRGSFDDLYSSFLAGKTRSGKSSWLRGLMLQSIVCYPGVRFFVLDPHRNHPDGLSNSLPKTEHFHFVDPGSPRQELYAFNRHLQNRLDHSNGDQPLVFVCDELNYCSKQPYANSLQALFDRISTEGAKAKCYLLASSQDTRIKKGLDFRDTLSSCYVFDLKSSQARFLLQDKDEVLKHKRIRDRHEKGVCLFVPTEDESQAVKVPYCSPGDVNYLEKEYGNSPEHPGNEGDENPETDGNSDPVTNFGNTSVSEVLPGDSFLADIDQYMRDHRLSLSKFAAIVDVNKGYLSECLKGGKSFSKKSKTKIIRIIKEQP